MRSLLFCIVFVAAMAASVSADTLDVVLRGKTFSPAAAAVKDGDTIRICNADTVYHQPFSYSKHNKFGPGGRVLQREECMTVIARNPTGQSIPFHIFDEIHANEKLLLTVQPGEGGRAGGAWRITQSGGYLGTLNIHQSGEQLSGTADWDNHSRGSISGRVQGTAVWFTIDYGNGLIGTYEALLGDGRMYNGTARSNKGGGSVSWSASRQ